MCQPAHTEILQIPVLIALCRRFLFAIIQYFTKEDDIGPVTNEPRPTMLYDYKSLPRASVYIIRLLNCTCGLKNRDMHTIYDGETYRASKEA